MKYKTEKKRGGGGGGGGFKRGGKKASDDRDPFFEEEPKKRRKVNYDDEDIESVESDGEENGFTGGDEGGRGAEEAEDEDEFADETPAEKRKRLAEQLLNRTKEAMRRKREERDDDDDEEEDEEEDDTGLIARTLMKNQSEESGRVRRAIASRVEEPLSSDEFSLIVKHRRSVVAVALSDDDSRGFSASKDGAIMHWDVSSPGKSERYKWPSDDILKSHGMKVREPHNRKHSRESLALAVSSDGRYLATGGVDRHVHIWDVRTREHVQAFPGHRSTVSSLCFRHGTAEVYSGSFDRNVKVWNAEDKAFVADNFGHAGEIVAIDALRKERVLSVGRDRTMQLHKVPEESRLIYRAPQSSLESCCFISDDEYLTGSDNGTVALWGMLKKKPVFLFKNAHPVIADGMATNGVSDNGDQNLVNYNCSSASSWVSSVAVCRGSDLAASGAGNGVVHLLAVETNAIRPLFELRLPGFVNSLAFAKSGKFLIAGVGQETKFGRWGSLKSAENGVAIHPLRLS